MIRLGIAGACGRMGQRIGSLAAADGQFKISGALEKSAHPLSGRDYGQVLGLGDLGVKVQTDPAAVLKDVDVLVDFAVGEVVLQHVVMAREKKKALVIGTTGLNGGAMKIIQETSHTVACVISPNMSPGINVLLNVVGDVAKALGPGYDIDIMETHHKMKKDAPSGTALALADAIKKATGRNLLDRMHSVRGGDVVGDHTVQYAGSGEIIQITHRATSRDTFAMGALRAAKFAAKAKPGLYTMLDVLRASARSAVDK